MSRSVGAYEAKAHLSQLLDEVEMGERVTITRHGVPIAQLVPAPGRAGQTVHATIEAILAERLGRTLGGVSIRELIEEGRRF